MECSEYLLKTAQLSINLYVIYCMPFTSVLTFCNDLANLIELNITKKGENYYLLVILTST